jgi:uncharacterized repeat protein (TIGR03837 family)
MTTSLRWDIFCRVVDNFGDAGVCWRLARQLAHEHGLAVTLWIDDVATLARIVPSVAPASVDQVSDGVRVRRSDDTTIAAAPAADVVIEGFGCGIPDAYVTRMTLAPRAPVWIVLEYLSAEPWIETSHALPSPHPRLPLTRWFWFPGFTERTGGLLRENTLLDEHGALHDEMHARQPAAYDAGVTSTVRPVSVSLFCYPNPALPALFGAWADGREDIICTIPEGVVQPEIERWTNQPAPAAGGTVSRGRLTLRIEPFVDQPGFDRRLVASDLNFVRGEDSLVRAQWAARPLVWHLYPQAEDAHLAKMDAYLLRQETALPVAARTAQREFWYAWNAGAAVATASAWPAYRAALPVLRHNAQAWARELGTQEDLATRLVTFCENQL